MQRFSIRSKSQVLLRDIQMLSTLLRVTFIWKYVLCTFLSITK